MRLLLTRPRGVSETLQTLLNRSGIQSVIEPLLDINIFHGPNLDCTGVAAIAMTSANGVQAFAERSLDRHIPVYTVGDATARAARVNNFSKIYSADGNVDQLVDLITSSLDPGEGTILHPAASQVAGDLEGRLTTEGYSYRREIIYEAVFVNNLSTDVITQIQAGEINGVALFSPRTGQVFRTLVRKAGLLNDLSLIRAYCLSPAVAETVDDLIWLEVRTAKTPTQSALLNLLGIV